MKLALALLLTAFAPAGFAAPGRVDARKNVQDPRLTALQIDGAAAQTLFFQLVAGGNAAVRHGDIRLLTTLSGLSCYETRTAQGLTYRCTFSIDQRGQITFRSQGAAGIGVSN